MKETIYTIPISEVFEPKCGCPVCTLTEALEERWVRYITGAAMMEPDVRVQTNEEGFCSAHLSAMLAQRDRLPVALLLQTRMEYLLQNLTPPPTPRFGKKQEGRAAACFLCTRIESELNRHANNLAAVWAREEPFRQLYGEQEYLCVPHWQLLSGAGASLGGRQRRQFLAETAALVRKGLAPAKADIDAFCKLFDYRSGSGQAPPKRVSNALERACQLLCGDDSTSNSAGAWRKGQ